MSITTGAAPVFKDNTIFDGQGVGVLVDSDSKGTYEKNTITNHTLAGMVVIGGASPNVVGNEIKLSGRYGVYVGQGASGTFSGNNIHGSSLAGIGASLFLSLDSLSLDSLSLFAFAF